MDSIENIRFKLRSNALTAKKQPVFYKTGVGQYAEHDQFIGVTVPVLRNLAKDFANLSYDEMQSLIESPINEERLLALFVLILQYKTAERTAKDELYQFYLRNLRYVNNWNLVDASAHLIMGAYLFDKNRDILINLARSDILWDRRIAIVATWYFIRKSDLKWTFKIAGLLMKDDQDLIHKSVGWMLREAGKRDEHMLVAFINERITQMPRTMLRYSIERFPEHQRQVYLTKKR